MSIFRSLQLCCWSTTLAVFLDCCVRFGWGGIRDVGWSFSKAQRRNRGIALLLFNFGAKWERLVNSTPGPVWRVREISPPTRIRSPDLPARSKSLYLLRYPDPLEYKCVPMYGPIMRNFTRVGHGTSWRHPCPKPVRLKSCLCRPTFWACLKRNEIRLNILAVFSGTPSPNRGLT